MILKDIWLDVKAVKERDPAARNALEVLLLYQGVHALIWHRVAHWFYKHHMFFIARLISQLARFFTLIEIEHPLFELFFISDSAMSVPDDFGFLILAKSQESTSEKESNTLVLPAPLTPTKRFICSSNAGISKYSIPLKFSIFIDSIIISDSLFFNKYTKKTTE